MMFGAFTNSISIDELHVTFIHIYTDFKQIYESHSDQI